MEEKQRIVHMVDVPAKQIPPWRYRIGMKDSVQQIMMTTWGGLGDVVCGEPAMRYAFKLFPDYEISCLTAYPDLFTHLPFKRIYHESEANALNDDEWIVLHTNPPHENMARDFITHHFTQVVDFSTLCALQRQIPIADRHVQLPEEPMEWRPSVVVHPGKHWTSKTFPKEWWDDVILRLAAETQDIAIIGKDVNNQRGTVNVCVPPPVTDLRNKLNLKQLSWVCKHAKVVLTNDSAPLHIAAAGEAHILFIASCKEPDHLMHWRHGKFGWRMEDLSMDGLWNHQSSNPIRVDEFRIDHISEENMWKILPQPKYVVQKINSALEDFNGHQPT